MRTTAALSPSVLTLDPAATASRIETSIRGIVRSQLRRRGVVVGLSGGVDSSVVGVLAARALGAENVLGLLMPEADSSPDSERLARMLTAAFHIRSVVEDITGMLTAAGCYRRRDEAIRSVVPEYGAGDRSKIREEFFFRVAERVRTAPDHVENPLLHLIHVVQRRGARGQRQVPARVVRHRRGIEERVGIAPQLRTLARMA